jgi:hypothetical protein
VGNRPGDKLVLGRKRYLLGLTSSVVASTSSSFGLVVVGDAADVFAAAGAIADVGVVAFVVAVAAFAFAAVVAASAL